MEAEDTDSASEEARLQRRIARAAKREKQRLANVDRAAKMHLARLEYSTTKNAPAGVPDIQPYHVGCSGWFYWHWGGVFYPDDIARTDWFSHYAKNFDTVELNAPFYSWPTIETVRTWIKQAQPFERFIYTIKVSELITHVKKFNRTRQYVLDFGLIADLLGPQFGCFLFQLPPSFTYTPSRLKSIVGQLDPARRNVVEFRHKSWWNDSVYRAFNKRGLIFCSCSGPRLPDELIKTADDVYVRFHGTSQWYRHNYTRDELDGWAARIRGCGAKHAWIYFNNDRDGHAIHNAKAMRSLLNENQ